MKDDPQQKPLYAWEDSFWGWDKRLIPSNESRRIIRKACRLWGIPKPTIKVHDTRELSWCSAEINCISMQKSALNIPISLHEVSHLIAWHRYGDTIQDHGPIFVGIYLRLLIDFGVAPEKALKSSLAETGIRWRSVEP